MQTGKRKKSAIAFSGITLLVIVVIFLIVGKNQISALPAKPGFIKTDKQRYQDAVKKHKNDDVVVRYEKECAWEKSGKSIRLVQDLVIYDEADSNKIFYDAGSIRVDSEGNIYVNFSETGKIKKYDAFGNFLLSMGSKGSGPGELGGMYWGFDLYQDSLLYTLDFHTQRITKFTTDGEYLESYLVRPEISRIFSIWCNSAGDIFVSYFDAATELVIHHYDSAGNHVQSFGDALFVDVENLPFEYIGVQNNSSDGPFVFYQDKLFFSRGNPYEIIQFDEQGRVKMQIYRDAKFMPPSTVKKLNHESFEYGVPVFSSFIGIYKNFLVNVVLVPPYYDNPNHTIIDFYDLDGQLLYTLRTPEKLFIHCIDKQGYVYGILRNDDDFSQFVRYKLEIE